jgi:hypothetical protein
MLTRFAARHCKGSLTWTPRDWPAKREEEWPTSHLARREGLKFELPRRHAHAMGQRQLPQCPTVARSRHARQCCRRRPGRVDISFEGRYRERSANVRRRRVEANHTAGIRFEVAAHSRLCYGGAMCPARA